MRKLLSVSVLVLFATACSTPASQYVKGPSDPAAEQLGKCRLSADREYNGAGDILSVTVFKQGYIDNCMRAAGYVPAK